MLVISRKKQKICAQKMYDKSTQLIYHLCSLLLQWIWLWKIPSNILHLYYIRLRNINKAVDVNESWISAKDTSEWEARKKTNFVCCFKNKWTLVRRKTKYILSNFFSTWEDHAFYFRSKIRNKGKHFSCVILREFLT